MPKVVSIDFETASIVDLRKTGAHKYAQHPSTRVLCVAWAFDDEPVQSWRIGDGVAGLANLMPHVFHGLPVKAWNANFEYVVWNNAFLRQMPEEWCDNRLTIEQLQDTMIQGAYWGLPLALDRAAKVVGVSKDAEGHRLMLQMCKPRTLNYVTGETTWWHEDDEDKFDRLVKYCVQDVVAEREVSRRLLPLPPAVQQDWELDQRINERGVGIDIPTVEHMIDLAREAKEHANDRLKTITGGAVPTISSTAKMLHWCQDQGYPEDNLRKATVEEFLGESPGEGELGEVLGLRVDNARTSTAKLQRMVSGADRSDCRVRGMMQFYGAARTGRWAGRLVQLQNMPRGDFKDNGPVVDALKAHLPYDEIEREVGGVASVVSSGLRACLVPSPGNTFVCADFSQIEARIVAWLAGQTDIVDQFASGADVYAYTASQVTGKDIADCGKGTTERQLGKILVLACGYGMGWAKFVDTAKVQGGLDLTEDEARDAVYGYRDANYKIWELWEEADRAFRAIVNGQTENTYIAGGRVQFVVHRDALGTHMLAVLPSRKRCLVYRNIEFTSDGDRLALSYMGIDQYTRKWQRIRTYGAKVIENLTQAIARDCMAEAMWTLDPFVSRFGQGIILTVHDELLIECASESAAEIEEVALTTMKNVPDWATGLPLDAEAWVGDFYRK